MRPVTATAASSQPAPRSASHIPGTYAGTLTDEQVEHFEEQGYVVFPAWIPEPDIARLKTELDYWDTGGVDDRYGPVTDRSVEQMFLPGHWDIMTRPELMSLIARLIGPGFGHHHIHTSKHLPGDQGVAWHHDYEQYPQANRSHGMLHTFWYLNGLDGTIGDLLINPGSQRMIIERTALGGWGHQDLPGTLAFADLPPGTMVVINSAVLHARRPKPGGNPTRPRYFIDSSYCAAGVRWPHRQGWLKAHARALADGRAAAAGVEHLFNPVHFYDMEAVDWPSFHRLNQGSLLPRLLAP